MEVAKVVTLVREREPLVHCITAAVSMNLVANALLATGARPMMTETQQEAPAVTGAANALLVNLGTLSTDGASRICPTVTESLAAGHPFVLDPAAVGRAPMRTALAIKLLGKGPAVVRANASEVMVLANGTGGGRGADSTATPDDALEAARRVASERSTVVAVSAPSTSSRTADASSAWPTATPC